MHLAAKHPTGQLDSTRRTHDRGSATRREFVAALKAALPAALADLQRGNITPVELAQAAIGSGMGIFTRYASVRDAQGMREVLALINAFSRWAPTWFDQHGFAEGEYGVAKSKNTSVAGLVAAGIIETKCGTARRTCRPTGTQRTVRG